MRTPTYRRNGDGRAFAVYPNSGGRRVYFGRHGTPEAEAAFKRWLSALLKAEADAPEPTPVIVAGPSTPLCACIEAYMDWAKRHYDSREYNNLRAPLKALEAHAGDLPARSFGPNALREFRDHLMAKGFVKGGTPRRYTRSTLNTACNKVRRFVRWCESRELLPAGTAASLATLESLRAGKCSAPDKPPVTSVPWEVVKATLPYCRPDLAAMIQVQFWCGMRPAEVCRMTAGELDRIGAVWWYRPTRHKNTHRGKPLVKAVPKPAQEILAPFIERAESPDSPLFLTRFDNPYNSDAYSTAVELAVKAANRAGCRLPHWTPNRLRHLIAEVVDGLAGREAAQHFLGHSRPDTTAIYAKRVEETLRRTAEELGRTS